MHYTNLGCTGLIVSRICLGMMTYGSKKWRQWVLEEDESLPFVEKAWKNGIKFFDTADVYSNGVSEEILGRAVRKVGISCEQVVIATKLNGPVGESPNQRGLSRTRLGR